MNTSIVGTPARRRWSVSALLVLFALVAGVVFAANGSAGAADPLIVDIRVELTLVDIGPGGDVEGEFEPRVFEAVGVEAKAGQIELSEADEISNVHDWCGSVTVDIDPDAGTITIATEDDCDFHVARVIITSDQIDTIELVSDDLWDDDYDDIDMLPVQITKSGNSTELLWVVDLDLSAGLIDLKEGGAAVFSFTLVDADPEPTTTTTTEAETTTTTAPTGGAPSGATPIPVTPSYTG